MRIFAGQTKWSASMSSAPRKKRDFFNGAQGLNLKEAFGTDDSSHEEPRPEVMFPDPDTTYGYEAADCGQYHSTSRSLSYQSTRESIHSPGDYCPTTSSGSQSPIGYGVEVSQDSYPPHTSGYHPQGAILDFGGVATSTEPQAPWSPGGATQERPQWPSTLPLPLPGSADEGKKKQKKRTQRCRMCANHGIYVEVKGHKWYCPYRDREQHTCSKCEITRKRQFFMAEQQKLTREQQQHQHLHRGVEGEGGAHGGCAAAPPSRLPSRPSDFPRMQELLDETDHILDEDLFRQIDECVRPKVQHH